MLEKIGLPAKPSARGASWVVDASHCQGCSAQFSLFTRKHHCQRCGGLFCSSCTQQRMVLRGQGDSPVRICDPCKKLEEAARFELRYGHKNRAAKANLKAAPMPEDEILSEILGGDGKQHQFSQRGSLDSVLSDFGKTGSTASASSSSSRRSSATFSVDGIGDRSFSIEEHDYELNKTASVFTPQELRQQAVEEKKKYKILKSEGKPEEALLAFKHGKELERQAAALEIELRKSRRMASKAPNATAVASTQKIDDSVEAETKRALAGKRVKKEKNDLSSELRELGWSDADLHDETKTAGLSVEGELSQLLKEVAPKSSKGKKTGGIDKSQVNALKRQALLLKREGRLAEAKEELKKAKILERQLEEQEILGEAEESDDDLAAIVRNMDDDNQEDLLLDNPGFPAFSFEQILGASDDLAIDGKFDVTDDDMNDPDMFAALKSFGWNEEDDKQVEIHEPPSPLDQETLKEQVLALKREAVAHRRAGNVAESMSILKKAKLLEKDLETEEPDSKVLSPEAGKKNTHAEDVIVAGMNIRPVSAPKSKLAIQRELLALKKRALALRREGKVDEAEEELKKGSVLEKQLEELENSSKIHVARENTSFESTHLYKAEPPVLDLTDEGYEPEVTDKDMQDPALLSVLKNMGWEDDDSDPVNRTDKPLNPAAVVARKPMKSKGQIQKELLAVKRKALAMRREGKNTEAEEELEKAKVLEQQISEIEEMGNLNGAQQDECQTRTNKSDVQYAISVDSGVPPYSLSNAMKGDVSLPLHAAELGASMITPANPPTEPQLETIIFKPGHAAKESNDGMGPVLTHSAKSSSFNDPLGTAKGSRSPPDALAHRELQHRVLVKHQESAGGEDVPSLIVPNAWMAEEKETMTISKSTAIPEKLPHGDGTLKDEILLHKRKAVTLKREGKLAEAREELKLAKLLEKRLEGTQQSSLDGGNDSSASIIQHNNLIQPVSVSNTDASASAPPVQENKSTQPHKAMSSRERLKIQRESLTHKRNALKLRREGKTAEADAEFELAKSLESQLEESDNQGLNSGGKSDEATGAVVEDLLDPQIMSALKSIGWSDADLLQSSNAQPSKKAEAKPTITATIKPQNERTQLEEQIKAEKIKALNFKREGKQVEALEALRSAKGLEKKLASLS